VRRLGDDFLTRPLLSVDERVVRSLTSADRATVRRAMHDLVEVCNDADGGGEICLALDVERAVRKHARGADVTVTPHAPCPGGCHHRALGLTDADVRRIIDGE
jgi:hypothetical protein